MSDVGHEINAISAIVDAPVSSKVEKFSKPSESKKKEDEFAKFSRDHKNRKPEVPVLSNISKFENKSKDHKEKQKENPFSEQSAGHSSNVHSLEKDEYGRPKKGSLTEFRGKKASSHIYKEMLELCSIIHDEGYEVEGEPDIRGISFGELFQIYTHISNKVLGILLRARKQELLTFEGECLFQKFHDAVPIYLLKPIEEIKKILNSQVQEIERNLCKNPTATTLLK